MDNNITAMDKEEIKKIAALLSRKTSLPVVKLVQEEEYYCIRNHLVLWRVTYWRHSNISDSISLPPQVRLTPPARPSTKSHQSFIHPSNLKKWSLSITINKSLCSGCISNTECKQSIVYKWAKEKREQEKRTDTVNRTQSSIHSS